MLPRTFPEANRTLHAPPGMEDTCVSMPCFVDPKHGTISCWQMSAEELERLNANGGRIWMRVLQFPPPAIAIGPDDPFIKPDTSLPPPLER